MKPVCKPMVNAQLHQMCWLQRCAESWRYVLLLVEHWISPNGNIREWLRQNARVAVWLFIPAVLVMPMVTFILWQFDGWLSLLISIAGKLVVLPILFLLMRIVYRTFAFNKR